MSKDGQWLAIGEAAKYLGISRDTLRRWERRGRLKSVRSPSNRRYYTKESLDDAMSGKAVETTSGVNKETKVVEKPKSITSNNSSKLIQALLWGAIGLVATVIAGVVVIFLLR